MQIESFGIDGDIVARILGIVHRAEQGIGAPAQHGVEGMHLPPPDKTERRGADARGQRELQQENDGDEAAAKGIAHHEA